MKDKLVKLQKMMSDKDFVSGLQNADGPEEARAFMAKNGIEFTPDELKSLRTSILKKDSGEMAEAELENVAGGSFDSFYELWDMIRRMF